MMQTKTIYNDVSAATGLGDLNRNPGLFVVDGSISSRNFHLLASFSKNTVLLNLQPVQSNMSAILLTCIRLLLKNAQDSLILIPHGYDFPLMR